MKEADRQRARVMENLFVETHTVHDILSTIAAA
jgi:hypothetical protein